MTTATGIGAVDYSTSIPNNVDLGSDRRVLRALERWQRLAAALLRGYCGRVVALAGDKPRYTPPP